MHFFLFVFRFLLCGNTTKGTCCSLYFIRCSGRYFTGQKLPFFLNLTRHLLECNWCESAHSTLSLSRVVHHLCLSVVNIRFAYCETNTLLWTNDSLLCVDFFFNGGATENFLIWYSTGVKHDRLLCGYSGANLATSRRRRRRFFIFEFSLKGKC